MAIFKKIRGNDFREGVEKRKPSQIVGGNVNW